MKKEQANAVYDILVSSAGAREGYDRESFVYSLMSGTVTEYRFCGALGFGGKFWSDRGKFYVNCYGEDMTDERRDMINTTNNLLRDLTATW